MQGICEHFINIKEAPEMFTKLCKELKPTAVFDSIGQNLLDTFANNLPNNAKIFLYDQIHPISFD